LDFLHTHRHTQTFSANPKRKRGKTKKKGPQRVLKSLSKPFKKILEHEPDPEQVQGSGLQKDKFGPSHFFQKEENQF
jgi:hypothetical protein